MLNPKKFINALSAAGIEFFAGVPDSLLSAFCGCLSDAVDDTHHVIAANEGNAVALAAGHYMGSGNIPCVYLQNSGLGNIINPLVSLTDPSVYSIPMILLIGWRGEPGVKDEPQHVRQGELTIPILDTLGIRHYILPKEESAVEALIADAVNYARNNSSPVALLVRKGSFEPYLVSYDTAPSAMLSREKAIELVTRSMSSQDLIVSTTGKISRELYEIRERAGDAHDRDFLVVGSMGHASQIAAGVALASPDSRILCLDGDGALLMHMGAVAINASMNIPNFRHVILNNGAHDSVGGMPTAGLSISVPQIAEACGYASVISVADESELKEALPKFINAEGPSLMNIIVKPGSRKDLGRPAIPPRVCKKSFMELLNI